MSDKCAGFVVVLDEDLSSDETEAVVAALHQFRGVIGVEPIIENATTILAECRARADLTERLRRALRERL